VCLECVAALAVCAVPHIRIHMNIILGSIAVSQMRKVILAVVLVPAISPS
jgi:hypothetical protein